MFLWYIGYYLIANSESVRMNPKISCHDFKLKSISRLICNIPCSRNSRIRGASWRFAVPRSSVCRSSCCPPGEWTKPTGRTFIMPQYRRLCSPACEKTCRNLALFSLDGLNLIGRRVELVVRSKLIRTD